MTTLAESNRVSTRCAPRDPLSSTWNPVNAAASGLSFPSTEKTEKTTWRLTLQKDFDYFQRRWYILRLRDNSIQ